MTSELFGTFSEPPSLSSGDPYKDKAKDVPGRWTGKQFVAVRPKEGAAAEVLLDKTVCSLAEGDRYIDAWIIDKRLTKKPGVPLSDKPFHCRLGAANTSISCGPGSSNGCLSPVAFDTDGSAAALRSNPPRRPADKLRNIYTTGPKRGGFGQLWSCQTLGEPPRYYSDVYEGGREKERELRKTSKPVSNKPFVSAATSRAFTPDTQLFSQLPATQRGQGGSSRQRQRPSSSSTSSSPKAPPPIWRPASSRKTGAAATSFNIPEYVADPVREARFHKQQQQQQQSLPKAFRPASGTKTRLSMWSPNPYATDARPAPNIDFTTL